VTFDRGREQRRQRGRRQRIDLFGDLDGEALGELLAQQLKVLLVDASERAAAGVALEIQLLLHLIAPCVCDLVTKLAKLHEVAAQGPLGTAQVTVAVALDASTTVTGTLDVTVVASAAASIQIVPGVPQNK